MQVEEKVTIYRPPEIAAFAGWEEGPAPPTAFLSRKDAVAAPEAPQASPERPQQAPQANTAGLQQAPQIVYLPSPFGGAQFVPGLPQFMPQMALQQTNPQNPQYPQMPYMPQQAFGAAFPYGGAPFGYMPAPPPAPAAPPAPAPPPAPVAPKPPVEGVDVEDPDASTGSINASDIPNPYPTVDAWLGKCQESQKKKKQPLLWDWEGIRAKFDTHHFLDKHIGVVVDMGLQQIREVFGFEVDEAAFLYTKASSSCQRVKRMFTLGLHG
jgi:hypothetical protein